MGGIISIAVLVAVTMVVLVYARVGALRGERLEIFITAASSSGLLPGSDVWLAGRKIGRVKELRAMPASFDSVARVLLVVEVLDEFASLVRHDAAVSIGSGGRLLGAPVVKIAVGSGSVPAIRDGDTLRSLDAGVLGTSSDRMIEVQDKLPGLFAETRLVLGELRQVAQLTGEAARRVPMTRASAVMDDAAAIGGQFSHVTGGADGSLMVRVRTVRARVDSLRTVLSSNTGTLGRFRRDSTLALAIAAVREEASALSAAAASPDGSLGRFAADSALQREMAAMRTEMTALMADLKKRPLRYLSF